MCLSVSKKNLKRVIIFSLLMRFIVHIYQGIPNAIVIGFVFGGLYLITYTLIKRRNLYPFL